MQHRGAARVRLGGEARGEPGLPHARLPHDHDDRALPQLPRLPQRAELGRTADERALLARGEDGRQRQPGRGWRRGRRLVLHQQPVVQRGDVGRRRRAELVAQQHAQAGRRRAAPRRGCRAPPAAPSAPRSRTRGTARAGSARAPRDRPPAARRRPAAAPRGPASPARRSAARRARRAARRPSAPRARAAAAARSARAPRAPVPPPAADRPPPALPRPRPRPRAPRRGRPTPRRREPQVRAARDGVGPERLPHAREQRRQPGVGRARRVVVPHHVDQLVAPHRPVVVAREVREQQPPLAAREVVLDPAPVDLDGQGAAQLHSDGHGLRANRNRPGGPAGRNSPGQDAASTSAAAASRSSAAR